MTNNDIRILMEGHTGIDLDATLLPENVITTQVNLAMAYFYTYKLGPQKWQEIVVDSSGIFTFTGDIPVKITLVTEMATQMRMTGWTYAPPAIAILPGTYGIFYYIAPLLANQATLHNWLERLLVGMIKKVVGQRLKFSDFGEGPFKLDAEAWFSEGQDQEKEMREFIMINRDEPLWQNS